MVIEGAFGLGLLIFMVFTRGDEIFFSLEIF